MTSWAQARSKIFNWKSSILSTLVTSLDGKNHLKTPLGTCVCPNPGNSQPCNLSNVALDKVCVKPWNRLTFVKISTIDIWINRLLVGHACLHSQFTSPTVHHQKWCYLPTHKPQTDLAEKIVLAGTNPPPPSYFCCCEWVTSTTFHNPWTNGEAKTQSAVCLIRCLWWQSRIIGLDHSWITYQR